MKDAKNKENAQMVAEMLNSFTFDYEGFCKAMSNEHRTLQQSFTRLCIHWLCTCASDEYRYDGRNEASHERAMALIDSHVGEVIGNLSFI